MLGFLTWLASSFCKFIGRLKQLLNKPRNPISGYVANFDKHKNTENLTHDNVSVTNTFYDLVTDFYEWGWGSSWHFATHMKGEPFDEGIRRHEYYLASRIGLKKGEKALDMGCGIGGPLRNICNFTGATVHGITINAYQIHRCKKLTPSHLEKRAIYHHGDFTRLPFPENEFDKVFAIEATCHYKDRTKPFGEAYRVLKPGGLFASYEWLTTEKYDENDPQHREVKRGIERGNGLPDLITIKECHKMLKDSGLELLECIDIAKNAETQYGEDNVPWYCALEQGVTLLAGLSRMPIGRMLTKQVVGLFETIGIAQKGSVETSDMLNKAAEALVEAGNMGIFTPMYMIIARKPVGFKGKSADFKKVQVNEQ